MSSFWAETGELTSPAGTGNQTYNLAINTGETPKAVIFFASFRSIGTSGSTNQTWHMLGFTTGSTAARNQCHCQQQVVSNPSAVRVGFAENACIFKNDDNATTVDLQAALNSFSTGAFELNWTTTASGVVIQWVALGGDDLSVFADNLDTGTGTGSQAETGVGFQPKAVLFVASRKSTTAAAFTRADAGFYVGVGKSSTERWASGVGNDDSVAGAAVETYTGLDNTRAMIVVTEASGAADGRFDITSLDSDGFTIDKEDGFSASTTVSYLAIGGANINVAVGTDSQKTSTGTKSTNVGFETECVLLWGLSDTALDTDASWSSHDSAYSFGAGCPPSDSRASFWAEDAGAAGQDGNDSTTKCIVFRSPTSFGTTNAEADIDASTSTDFVLNWTTADATARLFGYLAIGGVTTVNRTLDAAAGSYVVTGTAATPKLGRKVAAAAGSYTVSGTAATLRYNRPLSAAAGAYAVTGQAASLLDARKLAAAAGSYVVNGQSVGLLQTRSVDGDLGAYNVTGQIVSLKRGLLVSAAPGSYLVSGSAAGLSVGTTHEPCPRGVTFDGVNDWLTRGADLTGISDGRQGALAFWLRVTGGDGVNYRLFANDANTVRVRRNGSNHLDFLVSSNGGAQTFIVESSITVVSDGSWHHVMMSWDTDFAAGLKVGHIVIDDVVDGSLSITDAGAAFDIDYATGVTDWIVGAGSVAGVGRLEGDLAEVWFATEYVDFSVEANRRDFISAEVGAEDLGANGSGPTGNQPIVFLRGPATDFPTNLGTGGDFSVTGSLDDSADDPPCANGPRFINAFAGSYEVIGSDASLRFVDRVLAAQSGVYAVTGQDAALRFLARRLAAAAGAYTINGANADLEFGRLIAANAGQYAISGKNARLIADGTPDSGGSVRSPLTRLHAGRMLH